MSVHYLAAPLVGPDLRFSVRRLQCAISYRVADARMEKVIVYNQKALNMCASRVRTATVTTTAP